MLYCSRVVHAKYTNIAILDMRIDFACVLIESLL